MKLVIVGTGASGSLYLQRLLDQIDCQKNEVHLVLSAFAQQVIQEELGGLKVPEGVQKHGDKSMNVPFASGSAMFDAMIIIPCTMGTMGRIAHGVSDSTITRTADVFLKEKRKLILVTRETPISLIHVKNMELLLQAGADIIPANPCFYSKPETIEEVIDTVVHRVLDHIGLPHESTKRWMEEKE